MQDADRQASTANQAYSEYALERLQISIVSVLYLSPSRYIATYQVVILRLRMSLYRDFQVVISRLTMLLAVLTGQAACSLGAWAMDAL